MPPFRLTILAALLAASTVLASCAHTPQAPTLPAQSPVGPLQPPGTSELQWWRACFQMPFDTEGRPRWSTDLLLADRVAGPALFRYIGRIPLWRFHRRAGRDAVGHQLSLVFYTDENTAEKLLSELAQDPLLPQLVRLGVLTGYVGPCGSRTPQTGTEATSDPNWDIRLQRTWPHFIMGASAHWLALIGEVGAGIPGESDAPEALVARYAQIGQEINALWRSQGQHAYLHHLNALFGYESMLIRAW